MIREIFREGFVGGGRSVIVLLGSCFGFVDVFGWTVVFLGRVFEEFLFRMSW